MDLVLGVAPSNAAKWYGESIGAQPTSLVTSKSSNTGDRNRLTVIPVLHLLLHSIQAAVAVERGVLQA